jgi:hypothetical protein
MLMQVALCVRADIAIDEMVDFLVDQTFRRCTEEIKLYNG